MANISGVISASINFRAKLICMIALLLCSLCEPKPALADYQIVDAHGLVRAAKVTDRSVQVRIYLQAALPNLSEVVLKQLDGVAPDVRPILEADGSLRFVLFQAGSWQIKNLPQNQIRTVEITE